MAQEDWSDLGTPVKTAADDWSDLGTPVSGGQPKKKQNTSLIGDLGTGVKRGIEQIPGMVTGLADLAATPISIATGINKPFSKAADWAGEKTGFQPAKWAEDAAQEYSPAMQEAQANVDKAQGFVPTLKALAENPRAAANLVAESAPSTLAGGVLARGAMGVAMGAERLAATRLAAAGGDQAAKAALMKAGTIAGGIGEGAVTAGQQMSQTDESVDPLRAASTAVAAGIGTGILGAVSGRVASKMGLPDVDAAMAAGNLGGSAPGGIKNVAKRVATGAVQEGVFEEMPQSAQEQVWQNVANGKPWDDGVGSAMAQGMVAGSAMGAGVNALPRSAATETAPAPAAEQTPIAGLLPSPVSTGTPSDQTLQAEVARANEVAAAQANTDAIYAARDSFEKTKLPVAGPLSAAVNAGIDSGATTLDPAPAHPATLRERDFVPAPTGSFGQMNEFADLLGNERADVEARRKSISDVQQMRRDSAMETADAKVTEARLKETSTKRDALLSNVLEHLPEGQNPSRAFDRALRSLGFADTNFRPEEKATIERWKGISTTPESDTIPSTPNELDAAAMGIPSLDDRQRKAAENRARFEQSRKAAAAKKASTTQPGEQTNGFTAAQTAPAQTVEAEAQGQEQAAQTVTPQQLNEAQINDAPEVDAGRRTNAGNQPAGGAGDTPAVPDVGQGGSADAGTPDAGNGADLPVGTEGSAGSALSAVKAYPKGRATALAAKLTRDGFPTEAYPHPAGDGSFALRKAGEETAPIVNAPVKDVTPAAPTETSAQQRKKKSPIMQRDDIVGAIMRATGGDGVASGMAMTLAGDTANNLSKVRGLFTNTGQQDMDDLAMLLRENEGYDVKDGNRLAELIREAAAGNYAKSMERTAQDKADAQEKQHRTEIRKQAKKYGIKTVAREFNGLELEVVARMKQRHAEAVQKLEDRAKARYDAMLKNALEVADYDEVDAIITDAHNRLSGREFYYAAIKQLRGYIDDVMIERKAQEALNETEAEQGTTEESDWLRTGPEGSGSGSTVAATAGETHSQPDQEEVAPALTLEGQTNAQAAAEYAQEQQRIADEEKAKAEKDNSPKGKADQIDLFNTQGGIFDAPAANQKPTGQTAQGAGNKIFTADRAEKARELLRKKLGQLNAGIDPEIVQAGIELAGFHIESGARSFAAYSKAMIADIGDVVKPYLKSWYLAVRNYPGFDNAGMQSEADLDRETQSIETEGKQDQAVKWFGTKDKAQDYVDKKGLAETHEVVAAGKSRFEVREKSAKQSSDTTLADNEVQLPNLPMYIYGKIGGGAWMYKAFGAKYEGYAGAISPDNPLTGQLDAALRAKQDSIANTNQSTTLETKDTTGASDARPLQPEDLPGTDSNANQGAVADGNRDRQPVGAGVAKDGQGSDRVGRVHGSAEVSGRTGSEGQTGYQHEPSVELGKSGNVGSEPVPASGQQGSDTDHVIEAEDIGKGGLTKKYRDNVDAIRIIKAMEAEGRVATPEERKQIARYAGWGAIKGVFDPANKQWAKQHAEIKALLTDAEFAAARKSTLNAHYTSPVAVGAMYSALERMGFTGGRVLEPSVGVGNFFGLMPAKMRNASFLHGVELDSLTSRLVAALYPKAKIAKATGFQDFDIPSEFFDVVIGNPPFGSEPIVDMQRSPYSGFSIHNYFLAKSIDKMRPGGIMPIVVSHSFLDAMDDRSRKWISERASLIGGVRLPNTAFKENAGTEVVTDILIFQKKSESQRVNGLNDDVAPWLKAVEQKNVNPKTGETATHQVSELFVKKTDLVLGKPSAAGTMYSGNEYTVEATGDIKTALDSWVGTLPENIFTPIDRKSDRSIVDMEVPDGIKPGSFFTDKSGNVVRRGDDVMGNRTVTPWTAKNETAGARMRGMIGLRDLLREQMRLERSADAAEVQIEGNRAKMNVAYDAFLKKYGHVNSTTNRGVFMDDTESQLLQALEFDYDKGIGKAAAEREGVEEKKPDATKADIFNRRVMFPPSDFLKVSSAKDALLASLNYRGRVDLAYMGEVYSKTGDEIVKELGDVLFDDPQSGIVMSDEYLSGDVKTKLAEAKEAALADSKYQRNVDALEKVIPADKKPSEISVSIGASFVPIPIYEQFVQHITGAGAKVSYLKAMGQWLMDYTGSPDTTLNSGKFGTKDMSARDLFSLSMAGRGAVVKLTVRNSDGTTTTIVLEKETEAAREKQNAIKQEWQKWIWGEAERADSMASIYNDKMNRIVERSFNGEHMTFPGMSPTITLLQHQKNGVWRGLQSLQVLYDHVVGAGKTFEMATLAMEMRRLGIARKPLFVVPNHLTLQWRSEFTRLYPGSNILAATPEDFSKDNRGRMFSKIVTGDWDAVILGHSSLKKIGLPEATERAVLEEQLKEVADAIEETKRNRGDRNIIRDMEGIKARLEAKMKAKLAAIGARDKVLTFDELGVDAMFIDEMHEFKNLSYNSTMDRNPGMGNPAGSGKAFDLFVKTRWLFDLFGAKTPFITATGTPVSNSLVEMFNMQRYMQYPTLKQEGLHVFDAWAKQFGSVENVYEVAPSGSGFRQSTRFAKFTNLPALMGLYNTFADTITLDDLKAQEEARGKKFPVPRIEGGKPTLVVAKRSTLQAERMGVPRADLDDDGRIVFGLNFHNSKEAVRKDDKTGKWHAIAEVTDAEGNVRTADYGSYETEQEARMRIVEQATSPKVSVNDNSILGRFANLKKLTKETKGKVNALSLTGEANKIGLDYRLVDPGAADFAGSKINLAVGHILRVHKQWSKDKGAQLVFCDMSIPLSARSSFSSKERRLYVRGDDGELMMKRGTLHAVEGFEMLPYFIVSRGEKENKRFDVFDAATGLRALSDFRTKADAKDRAAEVIGNIDHRQAWLEKREGSREISQDQIDEYNNDNDVETDGVESFGVEDIAGMSGSAKFSVYDDIKAKLVEQGIPEREVAFIHDYATPVSKAKLFKAVNDGDVRVLIGSTQKMGAGTNVQKRLVALHHIDAPWRPSDLEQREGRIIRRDNLLYNRDPEGFEVFIGRYATEQTYDTRRWQILEHKARGIEQLRNFDGTTNEIEDIDGEAANAADMKAAASGDPLILEETKLRNEVKRLERLQDSHADERLSMERVAAARQAFVSKDGPAELRMVREILAEASKYPVDKKGFSKITVAGTVFSSNEDAAKELGLMFAGIRSGMSPFSTMFRGVRFMFSKPYGGTVKVETDTGTLGVWSETEPFSPSGFIQRMHNYIDRLAAHESRVLADIEKSKTDVIRLRDQAKKPFMQADDLEKARAEHTAVRRALMAKGPAIPEDQKKAVSEAIEQQKATLEKLGYGDAIREMFATAKLSRAQAKGQRIAHSDLNAVVETFRKAFSGVPTIAVEHESQLPDALIREIDEAGARGEVAGAFHRGSIYMISDNIRDIEHAEETIIHEAEHAGLRKLFGSDLDPAMLDIGKSNLGARVAANKIKDKYGYSLVRSIEEALAEMGPKVKTLRGWPALVSWVRAKLRKLGWVKEWTDQDVESLVVRALEAVKGKGTTNLYSGSALSRSDDLRMARNTGPQIVGDSGRTYDQGQRDFFKNVGREITKQSMVDKTLDYLKNDFWKKIAVGLVDQFRGLRDLGDNGQAYMLARLSKGTAGAFETLLHHGKLSIKDGAYDGDQSGGFIEKLGIPLQGELDDFLWYVASNRAEGLAASDRENLFTPADIAAGKSLANGNTPFDYTIQTGPSKGKVTRVRAEIYADTLRVFNEFQKNTLDMAEQSGIIDGASRKLWESEFYVPFYRVSEEDGEFIGAKMGQSLVRQQAFKKLKGGTDKLNSDLLSNTLLNWSHLIEASAKNRAARASLSAAENVGVAQRVAPDMASYAASNGTMLPPGTKKTVWFLQNGKKIEYLVSDPFVMTAITSLEYAGMRNGVMDVMTKFKHWLTIGVTASPAFKVRNLIRDSIQAIGTSDLGYNPIKNVVQGFKQSNRSSQEYVSALASGGLIRFGTMLEGSESSRIRQLIKSGVKDSSILDSEPKWRQFYDKYLEPGISAYNELGNRSEEINRASLYNQLVKQGKSHAEAALLARDLMDFSMQGSFNTIRFLTQVTPFLNARMQGLYKLGRSAKDNPRKLAIVTGSVALASIALMLGYEDDDDWKRREDWDRDNFWWFKFGGVEFRIPKPFEVGAVATMAERSVEYLRNDEMTGERFRKVTSDLVMNNLSMNPVPQAIKPIIDLYANKDSFTGRPIETMSMQRLDPTLRYSSSTSLVARGLSTASLGAASPVQIDHLARAYFGWLGSFVIGGADLAARPFVNEPSRPEADYWKRATQGIVKEEGSGNSRYLTMVYDQASELEQAHDTYRQMIKEGKIDDARDYADSNADKLKRYRAVEQVKRAESKFNENIRAIERGDLDPAEKKLRIERIQKMKESVAKRIAPGL